MKHTIDTAMRDAETLLSVPYDMTPLREHRALARLSVSQLVTLRDQQCATVIALGQFHQTLLSLEQEIGHPSTGSVATAVAAYNINKQADHRCQFIERICKHLNERDT